MSLNGAEFLIYKAIVSNNFFPKLVSLISLNYQTVLKEVFGEFLKNTALAQTKTTKNNTEALIILIINLKGSVFYIYLQGVQKNGFLPFSSIFKKLHYKY